MEAKLKVLFVCALNKKRSVTAERVFRTDPRVEVRSAGVRSDAPRRVSATDLAWADVVFAMEREHKQWIQTRFRELDLPAIEVLDIPDDYEVMDPQLQTILLGLVGPEIEHRLRR
ncbi:MAG TPA: protein tyrosine phosphatase [Opitutaceae bacterium]|nr:protein tyrosine phosphatase [Opitutaceae bacterium]